MAHTPLMRTIATPRAVARGASGGSPRAVALLGALLVGSIRLAMAPAVAADHCPFVDCHGVAVGETGSSLGAGFDPSQAVLEETGTDLAYYLDGDNDGLVDGDEALYGADAADPDSDGDTIADGDEIHRYGTWPWTWDSDSDSVGDNRELFEYGTNPRRSDTDGDGYSDYEELYWYATDPTDPTSYSTAQGPR